MLVEVEKGPCLERHGEEEEPLNLYWSKAISYYWNI